MGISNKISISTRLALWEAIRTGNLDLAHSAFGVIAGARLHWDWLKWKLPVIINEECWYMLGEYVEFNNKNIVDPKEYKKLIYKLVLVDKTKDSYWLRKFILFNFPKNEHKELKIIQETFFNNSNKDLVSLIDAVFEKYFSKRKFSKYEENTISFLKARIQNSGLYSDRVLFAITAVLVGLRELDEKEIKKHIKYAVHRYKKRGGGAPKKIAVMDKVMDKIPSYLINKTKVITNPTCFQTMWG